jgi:hypothetical protein
MGIVPPSADGSSHHRSNRDNVLEAMRRASYKSVIAAISGSDFSLKIAQMVCANSNRREWVRTGDADL